MDLQSTDPKTLDVAHDVDTLSFRFFTDEEALALSVRRITSPHAFDEVGRPIPAGLYDPALGPTVFTDGPCNTCAQSYSFCPGHFGHIQLPFAIPNPLLTNLHLALLRASCPSCLKLRVSSEDLDYLLARLYFDDASLPKCSDAVEAVRVMRSRPAMKDPLVSQVDETRPQFQRIITNWSKFIADFPPPLFEFIHNVPPQNPDLIRRNILRASRAAWKKARANSALAPARSAGWKDVVNNILQSKFNACPYCALKINKIRKGDRGRLFRSFSSDETENLQSTADEVLVSVADIEKNIAGLWTNHTELFSLMLGLKGRRPPDPKDAPPYRHLFVRIVLVPPSRFRPTSVVGNMEYAAEHPQNVFFQNLLTNINIIVAANEHGIQKDNGASDSEDADANGDNADRPSKTRYAQAMSNIQENLAYLYDSSSMPASLGSVKSVGIRQQLEAKSGLFRQHMMGKRVNFSARSVIGPDVFLETDEVGIPESFAKLLSIPEPVTPFNLEEMRAAVLRGPNVYPGALGIEEPTSNGDTRTTRFLKDVTKDQLSAHAALLLQNRAPRGNRDVKMDDDDVGTESSTLSSRIMPKRVLRHLRNGDVVLFNRQPSLHRVSIMAHRVRVLPGDRTIRFHYANCKAYNADFDGDEMNIHVPQDYLARAEAEELMLSSRHYIVPTSGAPVRGLIQDNVAAAALLSRRDTFLDRQTFMQLLYAATEKLMLRDDRVCKSYELPIPAILKPVQMWTGKQLFSSVLKVVCNGQPGLFLDGKTSTKQSVIGDEEDKIIVREGELLQGVIDKSSIGSSMYGLVHAVQEAYGCFASEDFLSSLGKLLLHYMRIHGHTTGVSDLELLDRGNRKRSSIISESIHEIGIQVANKVYQEMAPGSSVSKTAKTSSQAKRLIEEMVRRDGVEAEDRLDAGMHAALNKVSSAVMRACVPSSLRRSFPANGFALMTNTGAKGGAVNASQISCLLGSTVLEGKRVPRMGGSGATLPCFTPYDPSPLAGGFIASRFLTGITPQEFFFHCMSGREGLLDTSLKTANSGYLQRCLIKHLEAVRIAYDGTVRDSDDSVLQFIYGDDGVDPSHSRWLLNNIDWQVKNKKSLETIREGTDSEVKRIRRQTLQPRGTLLEMVSPGALSRRGAISEKFDGIIKDAQEGTSNKNKSIRSFLEGRYQAAAAQAGDCVGITAAQGVGEPSTQMTLNTFHHAGSSSAHVTLGIPRLRELLMTAAKYPSTPSMDLPVLEGIGREGAEKLRRMLQNVSLIDLMTSIEIQEKSVTFLPDVAQSAVRTLTISLHFPEEEIYRDHLGKSFAQLLNVVEFHLIPSLNGLVRKIMNRLVTSSGMKVGRDVVRLYLKSTKEDEEETKEEANLVKAEGAEVKTDADENNSDGDNAGGETEGDAGMSDDDRFSDSDSGDENGSRSAEKEEDDMEPDEDAERKEYRKILKAGRKAGKDRKVKKRIRRNELKSIVRVVKATGVDEGNVDFNLFGYKRKSMRSGDRKVVMFDWAIPVDVCGKVNMATYVKEAAKVTKIAEVARISKCFVSEEGGRPAVVTEGSNLQEIFTRGEGLIDFDNVMTNDMVGILNVYGVEALRTALIEELGKVFDAYGIPVDRRHLQVIGDYMTAHGTYRGFNRYDMKSAPSVFQRMTFETSVKYLTEDALNGTVEPMRNPSASIALSQLVEGGTGGFTLLQQV